MENQQSPEAVQAPEHLEAAEPAMYQALNTVDEQDSQADDYDTDDWFHPRPAHPTFFPTDDWSI